MKNIKCLLISTFSILLCSCSGFFEKDNTPTPSPLVHFTQEVKVQTRWHTRAGSSLGEDYLKLSPAITETSLFTASKNGTLTAVNKTNGNRIWEIQTQSVLTSGVAAASNRVVVGTREGDVIAVNQADGKSAWRARLSSEILAAPAAENNTVIVKSIDGKVVAFDLQDGHKLWDYQQVEPTLILRGASAPKISEHHALIGFANGNLVSLSLQDGTPAWQETIGVPNGSFAIQRMVDIDANPTVFGNHVYAATYQGRIAALNLASGKIAWTHDLSSYTGLAADDSRIYVSDAKSHLWAFDAQRGVVDWRQTQLEARNITGPALFGNYVVVGDAEGYLHWLSKQDGHFVARVKAGSGILTAPLVSENILYVLTRDGDLIAYTLG